jgi:hypothetical protein
VGQIADVMAAAMPPREPVNMIGGADGRKYGKFEGTRRTGETGDVEWARDSPRPRGSRESGRFQCRRSRGCQAVESAAEVLSFPTVGAYQDWWDVGVWWPEVGSGNRREGGRGRGVLL